MLAQRCQIEDLDVDQWKRLSDLGLADRKQRRLFLVHEGGKLVQAVDTQKGPQDVPAGDANDPQALAERLLAEHKADGVQQVWVMDLASYQAELARVHKGLDPKAGMIDQLAKEYAARWAAPGCAVAPKNGFIHFGLPVERLQRFAQKMLPASCSYVLGVFDGDALWASLIAQFENGQIVGLSTTAALDPDDVKDIVGRDQHPFLLAVVANRYRRPAFGWFCQREDFEKYMLAVTVEEKDEAFQRAIMENRATFDFNILVDRGITPLGAMNPGEAAVVGADREENPRTATPDPDKPGPSAF
jgi:hypothetical protein